MGYLFDTHALIWWLEGDDRFPVARREDLLANQHRLWVSPISFWEISIKRSLKKLDLNQSTESMWRAIDAQGMSWLSLDIAHLQRLEQLPFHHRDPFDRLLVAQAQHAHLTILTRDEQFAAYEVPVTWKN